MNFLLQKVPWVICPKECEANSTGHPVQTDVQPNTLHLTHPRDTMSAFCEAAGLSRHYLLGTKDILQILFPHMTLLLFGCASLNSLFISFTCLATLGKREVVCLCLVIPEENCQYLEPCGTEIKVRNPMRRRPCLFESETLASFWGHQNKTSLHLASGSFIPSFLICWSDSMDLIKWLMIMHWRALVRFNIPVK